MVRESVPFVSEMVKASRLTDLGDMSMGAARFQVKMGEYHYDFSSARAPKFLFIFFAEMMQQITAEGITLSWWVAPA